MQLVDGPPVAGVSPGDVIGITPEWLIFTSRVYNQSYDDYQAGVLTVTQGTDTNGDAHRYNDATSRFEYINYGGGSRRNERRWEPANEVIDEERWKLRLVVDAPCLSTVRRFGEHLAVRPIEINTWRGPVYSTWTAVGKDGVLRTLYVEERRGVLSFVVEERRHGLAVGVLESRMRGQILPELAAGIALQMPGGGVSVPSPTLGWDGVVRMPEPNLYGSPGTREAVFWRMTRKEGWPKTDDDKREIAAVIAATRVASPAEIAEFVRAIEPVGWAREKRFVEECSVVSAGA